MSLNLHWEPVIKRDHESLNDQLKYIFGSTYWAHDGTCSGEPVELRKDELTYLCGIRDGTRDKEVKADIEKLIRAIQTYGSVRIWIGE